MARRAMMHLPLLLAAGFWAGRADAQQATTVQLPTFSFFTVSTTVSVPDSGAAYASYAAGIRRSSTGHTAFGPSSGPGRRALGSSRSASSLGVAASIHDFNSLDEQLKRGASSSSDSPAGARAAAEDPLSERLADSAESTAGQPPPGSVAEARRQRAADAEARQAEALGYFQRADKAAADGKTSMARMFFQMAARRASGDLKQTIEGRLESLASATPSKRRMPPRAANGSGE